MNKETKTEVKSNETVTDQELIGEIAEMYQRIYKMREEAEQRWAIMRGGEQNGN